MLRIILLLFICFLRPFFSFAQTAEWEGSIKKGEKEVKVKMILTFEKEVVYGGVTYEDGKYLTIVGHKREEDSIWILHEYDKSGGVEGSYKLTFLSNVKLTGDWEEYNLKFKYYTITLTKKKQVYKKSALQKADITGTYRFYDYTYLLKYPKSKMLEIEVRGDSVAVYLSWSILWPTYLKKTRAPEEGRGYFKQKLKNNKIIYQAINTSYGRNDTCCIEITLVPGGAYVKQKGDGFACGFSYSADVEGIYFKESKNTPFLKETKVNALNGKK